MNDIINNIDKNIDKLFNKTRLKYKSKKNKRRVTIFSKPNINPTSLSKEDINKIKNKKFGKDLIKFRKKLYKKINSKNLTLLNNNISSLKVKIKYLAPEILLLNLTVGSYNIQKNKIKVFKSYEKETINHELLHMATTFYDKKLKIGFCGFEQILFCKRELFGKGLNEGYTELISKRYFNENNDFVIDGYEVCMFYAEKLEKIVGKNRMELFYFNANLMGLYKYLTKFDESSNIFTFIAILDNIIDKREVSNTKNVREHELLSYYLSKWYIKLKQEELSKNIIDKATFDKEIYDYLYSLGTQELYLENYDNQKEYCLKK